MGASGPNRVSDPAELLDGAAWGRRLGLEVLVIAALCALVGLLLSEGRLPWTVSAGTAHLLLTLAAAAVGAGSAILAVIASRLLADPAPGWIAAALVVYCVILLPWATVAPTDTLAMAERVARLVLYGTAVLLLVLSIWSPRRLGWWGGWVLAGIGGLLALGSLWLPVGPALRAAVDGPVPTVLVLVGWAAAALACVVDGVGARNLPWLRLGVGLAVLAGAQLYRIVAAVPGSGGNLAFAGLRLLGLLIVLAGLAHVVARALAALRLEQWEQQEELAATSLEMERVGELAAERDHELRNGLAGLAGITHLLDPDVAGTDHEPLKHAVLAELGRLHRILDRAGADPGEADSAEPVADYLVEPVLAGLVMLRRTGRDDVHLRVQAGLRAHGHPAILAQVVTNLLANCDRHAPGATVTVTAARHGDRIAVSVRDEGPGLPPAAAGEVFERGRRDPHAGGSGLGLHISRRLITGEGGTLELRTVDRPHGCQATVTVPVADTQAAAGALIAPSGAHAQP